MGLPNDAWMINRKHSFRSRIRNGRSHPHGNRLAHGPDYRARWPPTSKGQLLITTVRHDPVPSRLEHSSSEKSSKLQLKGGPRSSKRIGKASTLPKKQAKMGLII
ncbi:hypothetical protein AAG906_038258 [Vitis piasezkii]